MENMEEYRQEINEIDEQMAALFERRMNVSRKVAAYKKEKALPIKDSVRENRIIAKGCERISDPEVEHYYVGFQRNVMDLSCAYQERLLKGLKVAYSGVEGAYAHIAARKMFPAGRLIAYSSFEAAYKAAVEGEVDCAVLPLENSYAGEVGAVMDLAFSGPLYINRVCNLEIDHSLIALEEAEPGDIRTVVSHSQALSQCDEFIKKHGFETKEYPNTARAAKFVKECGDVSVAAIASAQTAEIFGLKILEHKINTSRNNSSRFAVFSRVQHLPVPSKDVRNNFILVFTARNEAGSLAMTLDIIGAHGFNLRNMKSRPMKDLLWNYYFYVEGEGDINTENGRNMLKELSALCAKLKLVGAYTEEDN
ncbi:MAG: chorismate mutase [Lachnospiraceae bacterium]|jgi:chorismate mutase/prephenate dehydratase